MTDKWQYVDVVNACKMEFPTYWDPFTLIFLEQLHFEKLGLVPENVFDLVVALD